MPRKSSPGAPQAELRYILLAGVIDTDAWTMANANLLEYERKPGDIIVRMCSRGGDSAAAFGILDVLLASKCRIITEAWGECSSAAALILQAGAERRVSPNCRLLLHNGRASVEAVMKEGDFKLGAKALKSLDESYGQVIADRSGSALDQVKRWTSKETYFTAQEAVRSGLADKLIGR